MNGRWYTCVTASGFDAEANRWANTVQRISGTALYVAATIRTLAVYSPKPFRLTVDGEAHELEAWLVAVGNGPAYAGGMHITPNASMHDGLLDVTVIGPLSKPALLWAFPRVFKGTHVSHPAASTFRGEHVELESLDADAPMDVYADGERVGPLPAVDGSRAGRADGAGPGSYGRAGVAGRRGVAATRGGRRSPRRQPLRPASSVTVSPVT